MLTELILGFGGYFSSFKTILFLATIIALGNEVKLERVLRPRTIALVATSLLLTTYWQAVKSDYRAFLNQGTQAQVELVSPLERLRFLAQQVADVGVGDLYSGLESGLQRLGYIDFLAMSIQQVPESIPYQRGRLWGEAATHILMPRLFFPSKPAINDSDRTNEFAGLRVAGAEQGTTISLGYVAESYIDFGPFAMFAPVLLIGGLWGWAYRSLSTEPRQRPPGSRGSNDSHPDGGHSLRDVRYQGPGRGRDQHRRTGTPALRLGATALERPV